LEIDLKGILVIVGNYGSGKTEVAINLAVNRKNANLKVSIADLDLVNPYFRTREAKGPLQAFGIKVVLPPEQYLQADLPILSPAVAGVIRQANDVTILDVGGDDAGATVLAALADALKGKKLEVLQVVNRFRPFTETVEGCLKIRTAIEKAAKIKVNGLIGNNNLLEETTVADIHNGHQFMQALSKASALPLRFITVPAPLSPELDRAAYGCPVLTIRRQLVTPWLKARHLSEDF
jgi:MinD-like ATPase involved in chromosome partitioning or flagellar assembly